MAKDELKTRTATVREYADGIIHVRIEAGADETLDDARYGAQAVESLSGGRPVAALIDLREIRSVSIAARRFWATADGKPPYRACALVVRSGISRMVANFYLSFTKPPWPVKLFNDEHKALNWLQGHQRNADREDTVVHVGQ